MSLPHLGCCGTPLTSRVSFGVGGTTEGHGLLIELNKALALTKSSSIRLTVLFR